MKQEYRTIDTNELSPYPSMTSDELQEFELWSSAIEKEYSGIPVLIIAILAIATIIALFA